MVTTTADVPRETNAVEAATAEVERLHQVELDLSVRRDARAYSLPELEGSAGAAVLDGADAGKVSAKIAAAKAELETLDQAIATARERRILAITKVFAAEAGELIWQAVAKREEASAHRVRTAELLAELEAHEDIAYVPTRPDRPSMPGLVYSDMLSVSIRVPLSDRLAIQAEDLERRAIAERSVTQHGRAEADSVEHLIAESTGEPMHIGPTIASIRAWAAEHTAKIAADIDRAMARRGEDEARAWGMGRPIRFTMYWGNGAIDVASSNVAIVPEEPRERATRHGPRYERPNVRAV